MTTGGKRFPQCRCGLTLVIQKIGCLNKYDSSIVNKNFTLIAKDWGVISTIHMDDDGFPSEQQKDQG